MTGGCKTYIFCSKKGLSNSFLIIIAETPLPFLFEYIQYNKNISDGGKMQISKYTKFGHLILNVEERIGLTSDIGGLRNALKEAFEEGNMHVALSFPHDSFLSSRFLALLIENAERANSSGGSFTVIAPNAQILEVLEIFGYSWTLRTVADEKDLLSVSPVAAAA
jgi:anti-anti-sigma regulatory factor